MTTTLDRPVLLARESRPGITVLDATTKSKVAKTGRAPFLSDTLLRTYHVKLNGVEIGDFHAVPVQSANGTVTIEWAARSVHVPPSTYSGGINTREDAVDFILSAYDRNKKLDVAKSHTFEIRRNKKGEFTAHFTYRGESIFWTEGFASKASAKNAIQAVVYAVINHDYKVEDLAG